ncbi:MAG: SPOR domain-containing protein [Gammaproteobacteria bacterium]|nr:SPOR domain-containing protein [Gammaproteobacteria bacterium]
MRVFSMSHITGPHASTVPPTGRPLLYRILLLAALLTIAPLAPAAEDDYEAGKRAYLAGEHAEALRIWQPLADAGNKFAQFSLGSLYFEGVGVAKNDDASAKWFQLAAEQGYAPAQFNLGNAYKHGQGVAQDDAKAADWWRKAAEQEFAPAQFNLGTQYYFGRGVPKDEDTAILWYRRAAENGHAQAQRLFSMTDVPASEAQATTPAPTAASQAETSPSPAAAAATTAAMASTAAASSTPPAAAATTGDGERWLLAQRPEDYTLQLLATLDEDLMRTFLGKHKFTEPVAYFTFQRDGKRWYAAVYGAYPDKSQAQSAVTGLPSEIGKNPPWIRQFSAIQKIIKAP